MSTTTNASLSQSPRSLRKKPARSATSSWTSTTPSHGRQTVCGELCALWKLHGAGWWSSVTGRPAGWCDLIAREWPVDGVVGENGAFVFWRARARLAALTHPDANSNSDRPCRAPRQVLARFRLPASRATSFPALRYRHRFCRRGARAAALHRPEDRGDIRAGRRPCQISSIHVNAWLESTTRSPWQSIIWRSASAMMTRTMRPRSSLSATPER